MCNREKKRKEKEQFDLMWRALFITGNNRPLIKYPITRESVKLWKDDQHV